MIEEQFYFHSPFSPRSVANGQGPALILQFILRELIRSSGSLTQTPPFQIAPYDWAVKQGSYNKVQEFASLLPIAFPDLAFEAAQFALSLEASSEELFTLLEPFIQAVQENENLLYFLLKHQNSPSVKLILDKICPQGLDQLKMDIILQYQKRGFYPSKWIN